MDNSLKNSNVKCVSYNFADLRINALNHSNNITTFENEGKNDVDMEDHSAQEKKNDADKVIGRQPIKLL